MAQSTTKDPQAEAAAGVGNAFDAAPGGLTPQQQTAFAGVQSAFTPTAPIVSPIQRSIDPGADAATKYLDTFKAPETADQIAERLRQGSQGSIDAINKTFDDQVSANNVVGQERLAQDNAISVLSGLTGSTEAGRTRGAVLDKNDKETQAINNQRLLQLQSLYSDISKQALDQAQQQREDATKSADDILARRKDAQAQTLDSLKAIAAGGLVDFDSFKNSPQNADVYQHALDAVGGSEQALRGLFAVNRPQDQLVGTPTRVGDHFIQAYQNPLTGKVSYDKVEVPGGLPAEYNNFQKVGDSLVAIPDGWDGDTSKLKVIAGGSGGGSSTMSALGSQTSYAKLTTTQKTSADAANNIIANLHDYRSLYDQYADKSGGNAFGETAAQLSSKYHALIFQVAQAVGTGALQKADADQIQQMIPDPTSVGGIFNAVMHGGKQGGLNAIDSQIAEYTRKLQNYGLSPSLASSGATPQSGTSKILTKDGQSFDASQLTDQEYQQAISDGYTPQQ